MVSAPKKTTTKPTRLTREQQQANTRDRLLSAAEAVFARLGYVGASVDLIAAEAGFSKGAVYSNFPNKEAIFLELLQVYMERDLQELELLIGAAPDMLAAAKAEWLRTMHAKTQFPTLIVELQLHARRSATFAKDFYALQTRKIQALARILEKYFEAHKVALPMPALDLASMIEAIADGLNLQKPAASRGAVNEAGRIIDALLTSLTKR